jgi:tyrosinase
MQRNVIRQTRIFNRQTTDLDMVKFALMVFITHFPGASRLPIPPLEVRAPEKVLPSKSQATQIRRTALVEEAAVAAPPDLEAQLSWFREDVKSNEHHEHWHVVYPHRGIPDGHRHRVLKKRQGELFFYMHEQMLARYDTERLAVHLPPVVPLSDYNAPISEGYDPTPANPEFGPTPYSPRPASSQMVNVTYFGSSYTVQDLATFRDNVTNAVHSGSFTQANNTTVPVTGDLLGAAEESSIGSPYDTFYGNHHGDGHVILGNITDPTGNSPGVMLDTAVAIRDPIFYRWHRHVDNFSFNLQQQQPSNDFSDAPPVLIRKGLNGSTPANQSPDIILCFKDSIPSASDPNFDGRAYGEQTFGGANWNKDFSTSQGNCVTTNELQTMMLNRPITFDGTTVTITSWTSGSSSTSFEPRIK